MSMLSYKLRSWAGQLSEREEEFGVVVRALVADLREAADTIELTEEGVRLRDAEMNSRAERTCRAVKDSGLLHSSLLHCSECGAGAEKLSWAYWHYCPNCGRKVVSINDYCN